MIVRQLVPVQAEVSPAAVVATLTEQPPPAACTPFSPLSMQLGAELSSWLCSKERTRRYPELLALAYWLRRAELSRLEQQYRELLTRESMLAPAGLAFHIAPGNVDTLFVYSWMLSALMGNRNLLRVSGRDSPQTALLCEGLTELLLTKRFRELSRATAVVTYPHDREITTAFSQAADLRVIWGGDETVRSVRESSLAPHGRELVFPDRFSFSVLRAQALLALAEGERRLLAERFFNDTYWFDQLACSSPRLVVWIGTPDESRRAAEIFHAQLSSVVQAKGYVVEIAVAVSKILFSYRAILDQIATRYVRLGNELTVLPVAELGSLGRDHCGGGLLFQFQMSSLVEIVPFVTRKDQTLSHFGFTEPELRELALALNGRGVDRMVPIGQALSFSRFWDGYDLLQAFGRRIHIATEPAACSPGDRPARMRPESSTHEQPLDHNPITE
jgi:hypothetical protein